MPIKKNGKVIAAIMYTGCGKHMASKKDTGTLRYVFLCIKCHGGKKLLKNAKQSIIRGNFNYNVDPFIEHEFIILASSM